VFLDIAVTVEPLLSSDSPQHGTEAARQDGVEKGLHQDDTGARFVPFGRE